MSDSAPKIIPFGKYKGQPLEEMAQDKEYINWLLAQSWFVEKFQSLYTVIINNFQEPSETPEHNAMQVQFLQKSYRMAICKKLFDAPERVFDVSEPKFEIKGFDIHFRVTIINDLTQQERMATESILIDLKDSLIKFPDKEKFLRDYFDKNIYLVHSNDIEYEIKKLSELLRIGGKLSKVDLFFEIKPNLSDNFPAVLRQIKNTKERMFFNDNNMVILLVGKYSGKGAKWEEVIEIFDSSDIFAIIEADALL